MKQSQVDDDDDVDPPKVALWRQKHVRWLVGIGAMLIAAVYYRGSLPQEKPEFKTSQQSIQDTVPDTPADPVKPPAPPAAPPPAAPETPRMPPAPPFNFGIPGTVPAHAAAPPALPAPPPPPDFPIATSYAVSAPPPARPQSAPVRPEQTGIAFKGTTFEGAKASPAIDETLMLTPGLLVCQLDNQISSNVPNGPFMCHTIGPVMSRKGVVLMEGETQIMGNYQGSKGGDGTTGNRLMAMSAMAWTPNSVWAPIVGPAADDLGEVGMSGSVDHRYMERFGGAVMLDVSQTAAQVIESMAQKGGNTYLSLNGGGTSGLAEDILRAQANLPPIFSKNHGTLIAIWITKPVDFSASYRLRRTSQ